MLVKNFSNIRALYVKSIRLRATFFNLITMLFVFAIALGLIFQGSYLILTHYNSFNFINLLFCFIILPLIIFICAILIDDMVALIFDCMNNPPFLKFRAQLSTVFFSSGRKILEAIKFNNFLLVLLLEIIPITSSLICIFYVKEYNIATFLTGYFLGGAAFSIFITIIFVLAHAINSLKKKAQEKYYDFLVALESHEISNGFLNKNYEILSLNYQMFQRFGADLPDIRAKEPNRKIASYFIISSILSILTFFTINLTYKFSLFEISLFASLSIILLSFAIFFLMPNFLGISFSGLIVIFILINTSLALVSEKKNKMFNVKAFPIFSKTSSLNGKNLRLNNVEYPVCKMRWANKNFNISDKYLTLLDIIPINGYIYNADNDELDDREWISQLIKSNFKGTSLQNIKIEFIGNQSDFGRSLIIYFPDYKIRVMAIRGTLRLNEFLYDLNIYSLPQSLKLFNKLTPVIGFLPKNMVRTIIKYLNADRYLGVQEKVDEVYLIAEKYNKKSIENKDEFIITGHSLGGIIAGIISSKLEVSGIALSPAGISTLLKRYDINDEEKVLKSLTTITMQNDIFGKVDKHLGSVNQLACRYDTTNNPNICHYPSSMLCELYLTCGDIRGREPLFKCNQEGVEAVNRKGFQ